MSLFAGNVKFYLMQDQRDMLLIKVAYSFLVYLLNENSLDLYEDIFAHVRGAIITHFFVSLIVYYLYFEKIHL